MISTTHVRTMARYNRWQNDNLVSQADEIGDEGRNLPRGAFFSSIAATFNHLVWGDMIWLHRFAGTPKPAGGITTSIEMFANWPDFKAARVALDESIVAWADSVEQSWLDGSLTWFSGAAGREITRDNWFLVTHFFNHQTHHRGQIHAMLTAAGAKPHDTDLFFMPTLSGARTTR